MDLIERTVNRGGCNIVTRAMRLKDVWNCRFVPETNAVDVLIGTLRRRLDSAGGHPLIVNVRGAGFRLDAAP